MTDDPIVLVDYDPRWPSMFEEAAGPIRAACGPRLLALHHVGSTSVPGLAAKPIIDMQGVVRKVADAEALVPTIEALGFECVRKWDREIPLRRYFVKRTDGVRSHHLHVVEEGYWLGVEHVLFRDHLRRHLDAVAKYAAAKRALAAAIGHDRIAYTMAKADVIGQCLDAARAEAPPGTPLGHAVVVGGTGMLADASLGLAARGWSVSVVARNARRLADLADEAARAGGRMRPVCVDHRDAAALAFGLDQASLDFGPPTLAVVWAHASSPEAPFVVAKALAATGRPTELFHVLASATADPSRPDDGRRARFAAFPRLAYREIVLGFVVERDGRSRWLRDDEISSGVLSAVAAHAPRTVVGVVEPWDARP